MHLPIQFVENRRFRPKTTCIYLQNLSKSDDFEGFEVEDIPTEPPLDQAKAFDKVTRVSWGKQFRRQVLGLYGAKHRGIGPIFLKTSGEL